MRQLLFFVSALLVLGCTGGKKGEPLQYNMSGELVRISRADHVTIDGDASEWHDQGTLAYLFADPSAIVPEASDLQATFRAGWSDTAINIVVNVKDDAVYSSENEKKGGDGIELFLADKRGGKNVLQYMIFPDFSKTPAVMRITFWDHRGTRKVAGTVMAITTAVARTKDGYCIEAGIPLSTIDVKAEAGRELGLEVYVRDYDCLNDSNANTLTWSYLKDSYRNNFALKRIELSNSNTGPVACDVKSYILDRDTAYIYVYGIKELAGKPVIIKDTARQFYSGVMNPDGEIASDVVAIPMSDTITMPLGVFVDGQPVEAIDLSIANYFFVKKGGYAFEDDIRLLKMKDKLVSIPDSPVLFIGHSMFRFWHCFDEDMAGYNAINRAFGGSKSEHIVHYYNDVVKPYKPKAIVYFEGANDFHTGVPVAEYIANVKKFLDKVHADFPNTKVFTISPDIRDEHLEYNVELKKLIKNYSFVEYIDMEGYKRKMGVMEYQKLLLPDNTHWNSKGYSNLTPIIQEHLKAYKK